MCRYRAFSRLLKASEKGNQKCYSKNYCQKRSTDSVVKSINCVSLDFEQTLTYLKKLGGHSDATLIILKTRPDGSCTPSPQFLSNLEKRTQLYMNIRVVLPPQIFAHSAILKTIMLFTIQCMLQYPKKVLNIIIVNILKYHYQYGLSNNTGPVSVFYQNT